MTWIKEARSDGVRAAAELANVRKIAADNKAAFDAEPKPTEKEVAEFLEQHEAPVLEVLSELTAAGYTVESEGPQYLYDGELQGNHDSHANEFSLSRIKTASYGMHDEGTSYFRQVYGIDWKIKHGERRLGNIRTYAMTGPRSHLGYVQYLESLDRQEMNVLADSREELDATIPQRLRDAISGWIQREAIDENTSN